jgi:hypothetical protein
MLPQDNPLLDFFRPASVRAHQARTRHARDRATARRRPRHHQAALKAKPSWDEFVAPLEDANERIGRAWGQVAHLHAVMDNPPLREAYNANLPKITQYWTELGQNQALFEKYKALRDSASLRACFSAGKKSSRTPCATSGSAARSCRRQEAALRRDPGRACRAVGQVFRKPAGRDQCFFDLRQRKARPRASR